MEATLNNYVVIAKASCLDIVEATHKRLAAKKSGRKKRRFKAHTCVYQATNHIIQLEIQGRKQ